jgi:hypothetical protein
MLPGLPAALALLTGDAQDAINAQLCSSMSYLPSRGTAYMKATQRILHPSAPTSAGGHFITLPGRRMRVTAKTYPFR